MTVFRPPICHKEKKSVGRQSAVRVIHDGGNTAEVQLFELLCINCYEMPQRQQAIDGLGY
jgi:hypothetical protein